MAPRRKLTRTQKWQKRHPARYKLATKKSNLKKMGMTIGEFWDMEFHQGYKCAICRSDFYDENPAYVDHDHATGIIRGLLCRACNLGLGHFRDSSDVLAAAIVYLGTKR